MTTQEQLQKLQFIGGNFSPLDARDVVSSLFDNYINFQKIKHLSQWERNHFVDDGELKSKLLELNEMKKEAEQVIALARAEGFRLNIEGTLEIHLTK